MRRKMRCRTGRDENYFFYISKWCCKSKYKFSLRSLYFSLDVILENFQSRWVNNSSDTFKDYKFLL